MGKEKSQYNVNGVLKSGKELDLNDITILFQQFVDKNGHYPFAKECIIENNVPHSKILKRIVDENNIVLTEWQTKFGKVGHVRCYKEHYDFYVKRFKEESNKLGRALKSEELTNNTMSLPSASWLAENCPDNNVKTYDDFVKWCGYESNKLIKDDEQVANVLIELENKLNRPLIKEDITIENLGFTIIVINRIWGSWNNCKKALSLRDIEHKPLNTFEYYKNKLDILLDMIYQSHKRKIISWRDIEDCQYGEHRLDHKTILKAFQREKMDFYKYVLSKGFVFKPNSWGMTEYSADGEKLKSIYEIDFSNYLNMLGFKYKNGYERDVMYKQFCNIDYDTKMNCDYVIHKDNEDYYIEIAGILYSEKDLDKVNKGKRKEIYRQKMNKKIDALSKSNVKSLILYSYDMKTGKYKEIVNNFLGIKEVKQCQSVVNE